MSNSIKLRAKAKKGMVTVKALINHPMETGLRKDSKTGKAIPAHYIQQLTAKSGTKSVLDAVWGGAVSANPYLSFSYDGAPGDSLTLAWADNLGNSDTTTISVS
jgi:sulfur-oxidizing protein SoxZ